MDTNKLIMAAIIINVIFGIVYAVQGGDSSETTKWIEGFTVKQDGWIKEMKESDNLIVKGVGDFVEKGLNMVLLGFRIIGLFFMIIVPAVAIYTQPTLIETYIVTGIALFVSGLNIYVIIELFKVWRNKKT